MAGGSFNHDNLAQKASMLLNVFVEQNELKYFVNSSDLKIRIESFNKIVYADALVICDAPIFFENRNDIILNPLIVVEVLSDSTKKHDQNVKFEMYQSLPSFKEYVLVHQDRHHVSVFTKQTDATWLLKDYDGEDATAILHHLHDCPLSLKRLYRGLELTK